MLKTSSQVPVGENTLMSEVKDSDQIGLSCPDGNSNKLSGEHKCIVEHVTL